MYACVRLCIYVCVCINVCVCECLCVCVKVCVCLCVHVQVYMCLEVREQHLPLLLSFYFLRQSLSLNLGFVFSSARLEASKSQPAMFASHSEQLWRAQDAWLVMWVLGSELRSS